MKKKYTFLEKVVFTKKESMIKIKTKNTECFLISAYE